jgi:hypothetical protein
VGRWEMNIIELAKQAGYQHLPTVRLAYSGFDLERFAALVRAEVLEEAIDLVAFHGGSVEIEAAIRALKEST